MPDFAALFPDFPRSLWPAMVYELWRYTPGDPLGLAYRLLNLAEAAAWFVIAAGVGVRAVRLRRAPRAETLYVLLFALFGLSDVWEAHAVPLWLIAAKGLIFAGILLVRRHLLKHAYPGRRF